MITCDFLSLCSWQPSVTQQSGVSSWSFKLFFVFISLILFIFIVCLLNCISFAFSVTILKYTLSRVECQILFHLFIISAAILWENLNKKIPFICRMLLEKNARAEKWLSVKCLAANLQLLTRYGMFVIWNLKVSSALVHAQLQMLMKVLSSCFH